MACNRSSGIQEDSESESMHSEGPPAVAPPVEERRNVKDSSGAFDVFDKSRKRLTAKLSLSRIEAKEIKERVLPLPSPRIGSIEELLRVGDVAGRKDDKETVKSGPLHKAKKHFKTLISGTKRVDKSMSPFFALGSLRLKLNTDWHVI